MLHVERYCWFKLRRGVKQGQKSRKKGCGTHSYCWGALDGRAGLSWELLDWNCPAPVIPRSACYSWKRQGGIIEPLGRLKTVLNKDSFPALLRVGGRLSTSHHLPVGTQYPVILPPGHNITQLIIMDEDACWEHAQCQLYNFQLRSMYWVKVHMVNSNEPGRRWTKVFKEANFEASRSFHRTCQVKACSCNQSRHFPRMCTYMCNVCITWVALHKN